MKTSGCAVTVFNVSVLHFAIADGAVSEHTMFHRQRIGLTAVKCTVDECTMVELHVRNVNFIEYDILESLVLEAHGHVE